MPILQVPPRAFARAMLGYSLQYLDQERLRFIYRDVVDSALEKLQALPHASYLTDRYGTAVWEYLKRRYHAVENPIGVLTLSAHMSQQLARLKGVFVRAGEMAVPPEWSEVIKRQIAAVPEF